MPCQTAVCLQYLSFTTLSRSLSLSLTFSLCPSSSPILCPIICSSCTKIAFTCHFNRIFVAVLACKRCLLLLSLSLSLCFTPFLHFLFLFLSVYAQMFCFAKKYDCNILLTSLLDLKTTEEWERAKERAGAGAGCSSKREG